MKMQNVKCVITGIKRFNGEVEGTRYDYTKVYVETDMNEGENSKGTASAEYRIGDSAEYDRFAHHVFPLEAECDITITTNGKRAEHRLKVNRVLNQGPQKKVA